MKHILISQVLRVNDMNINVMDHAFSPSNGPNDVKLIDLYVSFGCLQ